MLRWIWVTAIITVVVAIIITWQAKVCETAREECQAAAAAHPLTNTLLPIPIRSDSDANQQQTQNQTSGACAHANAFLCRVLTPANLPTIYLVLIGVGGIVVAIGTLRILDEQTKAAWNSAEAARLSAQAFSNTNRPWLLIPMGEEFSEIDNPLLPDGNDKRVCHVSFKLRNFGQTPARITRHKVRLYLGDSEVFSPVWAPFDEVGSERDDYTVAQASTNPIQAYLEPDGRISADDKAAVTRGLRYVWLCGFIRYRDASDLDERGPLYETRLCYLWMNRTSRPTPFWIISGPPSHNRCT